MRVVLTVLLVVARPSAAFWDCPFPSKDLPTYQQIAQEVLTSLNSSFPKDVLTYGNVHTESVGRLQCASSTSVVRASEGPIKLDYATVYKPILWPNRKVLYTIWRSNYTTAAVARLEAELQWVNNNTCVTFEEVPSCSAGEKCVLFTPPSEETLRTYTPAGYPPEDFNDTYYVSRTSDLVEVYGILDWVMWILGFMQDHNRYDRDKYLAIMPIDGVDMEWLEATFLKNVQSIVHTVFPYDPQSATHMTLSLAASYGANLTTLNPEYVIKDVPDGQLSPIDVQKVHYYYCHDTLTFPVSTLVPELQSPETTTPDNTEPPQTITTPVIVSPVFDSPTTTTTNAPPTTTTTTATSTTMDARFTLDITFGFDDEPLDEPLNTTTSSTSVTTSTTIVAASTSTTVPTTTSFPMTSTGVRLPSHSSMRLLETLLLVVTSFTYRFR